MDTAAVLAATRRWIESMVIGLNLCPFAQRVYRGDLIRYVVSEACDEMTLLEELQQELHTLQSTSMNSIETTLLIHPQVLRDFLDFNDFLHEADALLKRLDLEGVVQIASFHPEYQFAGTQPHDVENYTNRAPFPILHLLREESITQVARDSEELLAIPRRNVATLRRLGITKIRDRYRLINPQGPEV
jgi:hypothetical protein